MAYNGRNAVFSTFDADEDLDVLDIHLSCRLSVKSIRGQPVDDRFRTHACERPHTRWVVPLISAHQRPAAAGDNTPRIIYGQARSVVLKWGKNFSMRLQDYLKL